MKISKKDLHRIRKSKLNTTTALTTAIIMGVVSFIERTVFNRVFLVDYLGLYSFFHSTINVLATAELGISTAIAYALYAPIDRDDKDQIWAIMRLLKHAYIIIGSIILAGGLVLLPFLDKLLITSIEMSNVRIYFLVFLLATVFNYYLSYENILIIANQESYKVTFITNTMWTLEYVAQIFISIYTKNFFYYSLAILGANVLRALFIRRIAKKEYPYIRGRRNVHLDRNIRRKIADNTKGLMLTKIGAILVNSTDSILISAMVGAAFLGKYSNYQMITAGIMQVTTILPNAVAASIGNIGVSESKRKVSSAFRTLNLSSFLIYGPLTIILINITNPIISVFFGADRTLPTVSVILIFTNFYLTNFREILLTFKGSLGLYYYDRKRPVIEGATNLVLSYLLGRIWGFNGIIGATIITNLTVNLWIEPVIIHHYGLKRSSVWFYISSIARIVIVILVGYATYRINLLVEATGILLIMIRLSICLLVIVPVFFVIYRKSEEARNIISTLVIAFKRKKDK